MRKYVYICLTLIFLFLYNHTVNADSITAVNSQVIIINKASNTLAFYDDYRLVKVFTVATGKVESFTPEGIYPIVNKIKNRPYYKKNIPGGDPRNPLGNRWLGLEVNDTYGTTYAIHGNNNPDSIGKYASLGCIRMHNEDVEWLYERVEVGTNVIIVNSNDSFNTIAANYGYDVNSYFYHNYYWEKFFR